MIRHNLRYIEWASGGVIYRERCEDNCKGNWLSR